MSLRFLLILFVHLWISGCEVAQCESNPFQKSFRIAVTLPPICQLIRELGVLNLHCLMPANASPHDYEPRPSDAKALNHASLLIFVSKNLDGWATKYSPDRSLELISLLPPSSLLHLNGGAVDPHIWTDPVTLKELVPSIVKFFCRHDERGCENYKKRAEILIQNLVKADDQIRTLFSTSPQKNFMLAHPFLHYFRKRYLNSHFFTIQENEHHPISPLDLRKSLNWAKRHKIGGIFVTPQVNNRYAHSIASSLGVKVISIDPFLSFHEGPTEGPHEQLNEQPKGKGISEAFLTQARKIHEALR